MSLHHKSVRSLVSRKLVGAFFAAFALLVQPLLPINVPSAFAAPVISEAMPNPITITDAEGEWVELRNDSTEAVNISGWKIAGATIPNGSSIQANGLFVLCKTNKATTKCNAVASGLSLGNSGTQVINLLTELDAPVDSFSYTGSTEGSSIEVVRQDGAATGATNSTDTYATNQTTPNSNNTGTPGAVNRNQPTVVNISTVAELRSAIKNQADGQTWNIAAGEYGLAPFTDITVSGQAGWYFPITANNLTINGTGNPTIYGTGYSANGNWATQNLVSVFGNNVTINGFTFMPKVQPNKTLEVLGSDFTLRNTVFTPNTLTNQGEYTDPEDMQWGGSLYFNHAGNHVIENVTIHNAGISYRYSPSGTNISLSNVTLDYASNVNWINSYRYSSAFNNSGNNVSGAPSVVYHVSSSLNNLASVLAAVKDGDKIELDSNLALSQQLTLTKTVTINGNGHTITGNFTKSSNDNNSVIGVQADNVTLEDLTVDAVNGTANMLHGINVYEADGVTLTGVRAINGRSGVVVGQGSTVVIDGIETAGNIWHGINVDKPGSHLTIRGNNTHTEARPIFVDSKTVGTVVDADDQYSQFENGNTVTYILSSELSDGTGGTVTLPAVGGVATTPTNHETELTLGTTTVIIAEGTTVRASDITWDGTILAPTAVAYAVPGAFKTGLALKVGSHDVTLTFDKAVKLVLPGQAGKQVGFVSAGSTAFTEITTNCSAYLPDLNINMPEGGDCKTTDGDDLVIWTKHFTTFVTYSEAEGTPSSNGQIQTLSPIPAETTARVVTVSQNTTPDVVEVNRGDILGSAITKNVAKTPSAVIEPSEEGWKLAGLAWYWWVVIIAALGAAGWASYNWYRRNGEA